MYQLIVCAISISIGTISALGVEKLCQKLGASPSSTKWVMLTVFSASIVAGVTLAIVFTI